MSDLKNIPDSEVSFLKAVYAERYSNILRKIEPLQKEIAQMVPVLQQLGIIAPDAENMDDDNLSEDDNIIGPADRVIHEDGYNPTWKWLQKIQFVLEKSTRPHTSTEIIEEILRREPKESKSRLLNSIPATLSTAAKLSGTGIDRKQNLKAEYEYFLVEDLPF